MPGATIFLWTRRTATLAAVTGFLVGAAAVVSAPALAVDFRLGAGEVLEVSVAGLPDLKSRMAVDLNGEISVPLLGSIRAEGLTLAEVRQQIQRSLPERILQRRTVDSTNGAAIVQAQDVNVSVVEYRPVYVAGEVMKPGEYPFRPGMTVRQAVILAGDYDRLGGGGRVGPLERLNLQRELDGALLELGRLLIRQARLRAQLAGSDFTPSPPPDRPELAEFAKTEAGILEQERKTFVGEVRNLKVTIGRLLEQIAALKRLREQQEDALKRQTSELENVRSLYQRGVAQMNRIGEEQRALSSLSERLLQTTLRLQDLETRVDESTQRLESEQDKRRERIISDLQEVQGRLDDLRAAADSWERMVTASGGSATRSRAAGESGVQLTVRRAGGTDVFAADETTAALPGDVIIARLENAVERQSGVPGASDGTSRPAPSAMSSHR